MTQIWIKTRKKWHLLIDDFPCKNLRMAIDTDGMIGSYGTMDLPVSRTMPNGTKCMTCLQRLIKFNKL